jgi:hypothetical protein
VSCVSSKISRETIVRCATAVISAAHITVELLALTAVYTDSIALATAAA